MRRALLAASLALAALAAGCGSSPSSANDFQGDQKQVAEQVEKLQTAGETGDAKTICDELLSKQLRDEIAEAGSDCASEMDNAIKDADDYELDVEGVTIQGDSATAKVRGKDQGKEVVRDFRFVREGGTWRAASLG